MNNPLERILHFPDADFVDNYFRTTMPSPYNDLLQSPRENCAGTNYLICYVQRSGSTHLTSLLQSTGLAGKPADFLNPAYAGLPLENRQVAARTGALTIVDAVHEYKVRSVSEYLHKIAGLTRSPNGVFGLKVDLAHASSLVRSGLFFHRDWNWKYIYLTREDSLMQAISYCTAMETGLWSSLSVSDRAPGLTGESVVEYLMLLSDFMRRWECIFALFDISPLRVQYEQVEADPESAVGRCLQAIGISPDPRPIQISSAYNKQRSIDAEKVKLDLVKSAREYCS
jgi:LPS sulfotransferase NodH